MNFQEALKQTSRTIMSELLRIKTFVILVIAGIATLEAYIGEGIKLFKELLHLGWLHNNAVTVIVAIIYLVVLLFSACVLGAFMLYLKVSVW